MPFSSNISNINEKTFIEELQKAQAIILNNQIQISIRINIIFILKIVYLVLLKQIKEFKSDIA